MQLQVCEGKAKLFKIDDHEAFYNETQIFNRDMSMLATHTFLKYNMPKETIYKETATILDSMSASGLRALRYCQEMQPSYTHLKKRQTLANDAQKNDILSETEIKVHVVSNDISESAIQNIRNNFQNQDAQITNITINSSDCNKLMNSQQNSYTVIDIDPYGHPSVFFHSAINALENGGFLQATATDGLITCGHQPEECLMRYQAHPADAGFCHEFSVRMVLGSLAFECIRQKAGMEVLHSFFKAHYLRFFARIDKTDKLHSRNLLKKIATFCYCKKCYFSEILEIFGDNKLQNFKNKCPLCSSTLQKAGPVWIGDLAQKQFLEQMLVEIDSQSNLKLCQQKQLKAQIKYMGVEYNFKPLFLEVQQLGKVFSCPCISNSLLLSYCASLGKKAIPTSFDPQGIKWLLTPVEILNIYGFWWQLQTVANKVKKPWSGQEFQKIKVSEAALVEICDSVGIENSSGVVEKMKVLEYVGNEGDANYVNLNAKYVDQEWKNLRDLALFESNPQKNWGPKKMK